MEQNRVTAGPSSQPLDLARTVQTSQTMNSTNFWGLGDQGVLVHSDGDGNILVQGDTSVLVQDAAQGLDLGGGTVTRIVSVADLTKLGINLSSDLSKIGGVDEREGVGVENTVILSTSDGMKTFPSQISVPLSAPQPAAREIDDLNSFAGLELSQQQPRFTSRPAQLQLETIPPRMVYQEKPTESILSRALISIPEISRINPTDIRLLSTQEKKTNNILDINIGPPLPVISTSTQSLLSSVTSTTNPNGSNINVDRYPSPPSKTLIELVGQSLPDSLDLHPAKQLDTEEGCVINRVADGTFPTIIQEEIFDEYRTSVGHDAIWRCHGGGYKVHKLVLAMSSPYLKDIMMTDNEDSKTLISTPDLSCRVVKSILCLFYTGKVNIGWDILSEVNNAFKLIGFSGDNVSVTPTGKIKEEIQQPDFDPVSDCLEVQLTARKKRKRNKYDSDDDFIVGDSAFDGEILGSDDEEWMPRKHRKRIKSEVNSEEDDFDLDSKSSSSCGFKRGRKSLKTPDTRECFRTRGLGKGERSFKLAQDLFDGRHVDFIYVCHTCYRYFDTEKKLTLHKSEAHPKGNQKGEYHTASSKKYKCPTCTSIISVKHLVWFIKHLKYCGQDDDLANQLIQPDDYSSDEEDNPDFRKKYSKRLQVDLLKDTSERLRITGEQKGKNVQTLSKVLVGEVVDYIWGCRACYTVFLSQADLDGHIRDSHGGVAKHGQCWNQNTENYTCLHCNQLQNSRHLVWFIYHMRKCLMGTSQVMIKKEECEDAETDEDTTENVSDPEGIVNKPFRVSNEKSEWICMSLFGRSIPMLFPCHICYSVFVEEAELRHHFRMNHPGQANLIESGIYYNKIDDTYQCPGCLKNVCGKKNNSIYFTHHYRTCNGQTFPVKKACPACNKDFDVYKNYKRHVDTNCETREYNCHLCSKVFLSSTRLNYHVQYVHTTMKPFNCQKCMKSYKRKAELLEHEEMSHSPTFNYSCDKCGKQFYGKKNLALHMKTHYTEEEKKHVCYICGYRFAKVKFLKNHLTTHSDVRQFCCEVCGARVKTRDTLKQHRKKIHNLLTPVPKTAMILDPVTGIQQTLFIKDENSVKNIPT